MNERTEEDFESYTIRELFEELMNMQQGDLWDGMSSKGLQNEKAVAYRVFERKMIRAGIDWS